MVWTLLPKEKHKNTSEQYFIALMTSTSLPQVMASSSLLRDYPSPSKAADLQSKEILEKH